MKIWPFSDIHGEFAPFGDFDRPDHDAVVIAGDFLPKMERGVELIHKLGLDARPVLYVGGNHEFYGTTRDGSLAKARTAAEAYPNIHVLQDDAIIIDGVRFLGATLWTDYCLFGEPYRHMCMTQASSEMNDHKRIRVARANYRRWFPKDACEEHLATRRWMAEVCAQPFDGKTVIITHHAPSPRGLEEWHGSTGSYLDAAYASDMERFVDQTGATLWFHGHTHIAKTYEIGDCRVISNARGYAMGLLPSSGKGPRQPAFQVEGFDRAMIVEI